MNKTSDLTFSQYLNKCSKLCHVTLRVIKHSKQSILNQEFMKLDTYVNLMYDDERHSFCLLSLIDNFD